jgi:hypothetical protein
MQRRGEEKEVTADYADYADEKGANENGLSASAKSA